jgi:SAM-dependent methyltransferase
MNLLDIQSFPGHWKKFKKSLKAQKRRKVFESGLWDRSGDQAHRKYESYEAYKKHQASKLDEIQERLQSTFDEDLEEFERRFSTCDALSSCETALCLGARIGTEVKALHKQGLFAVGIDLNPGKDNEYVMAGDFHALVFPDQSVDMVYTNALDHAFDLNRIIGEVSRVLKEDGIFLLDFLGGFREDFTPGKFESFHWRDSDTLLNMIGGCGPLVLESTRDLGRLRRDNWYQAVFRKQAVADR